MFHVDILKTKYFSKICKLLVCKLCYMSLSNLSQTVMLHFFLLLNETHPLFQNFINVTVTFIL